MRQTLVIGSAVLLAVLASVAAAQEFSNVPKPIPATRPEMKVALEALKLRKTRVPLPPAQNGESSLDDYLPKTWGRGGGLNYFAQIYEEVASAKASESADAQLDALLVDLSFWVVSRGNNCHYCLGHEELNLRFAGLDDDRIAALDSDWGQFTPREQAALAFARKLTLEPQSIGNADIAALQQHFSDAKIIQLAFSLSLFNSVNRWTDGLGLPQETPTENANMYTLKTPTSERFQVRTSIVTASTRKVRPMLATPAEVREAIAAASKRPPRVKLPTTDTAAKELREAIGERAPFEWERALAQIPVNGKAHVAAWNSIRSDNNLPPRLKAELAFITAVNNRAWYAAAHAAQRLKQLGASPAEIAALLKPSDDATSNASAAHRLAAKSTTDPHLITDVDITAVRKQFSDQETVEIMQVICLANLFDRFTESLGLPAENSLADGPSPIQP